VRRLLLLIIIFLALFVQIAEAPPSVKTVRGTVFAKDGITQARLGTNVFINDTNSSVWTTTKTSGPPSQTGRYSAALLSTTGDKIKVIAFNETSWGNASGIMGSSQVVIDVTLNRNRTSEAKVVIRYPRNNTMVDALGEFNVTANITILGADGVSCNATLIFSNSSVFPLTTGTHNLNLGNRARGVPMLVKWNSALTLRIGRQDPGEP
jgi:hypothetical protein